MFYYILFIDAVIASKINAEMNETKIETDTNNFIGTGCSGFDVILIGDMFYDEEFGKLLFTWLTTLAKQDKLVSV